MGRTLKEIKKALPDLESEKVEVLSDELDKVLAIKKLFDSEGGKVLLGVLRNNCSRTIRKAILAAKASDEKLLLATVLEYSANMDLLSSLQDIKMEDELRTQLDEAVKDAYRT